MRFSGSIMFVGLRHHHGQSCGYFHKPGRERQIFSFPGNEGGELKIITKETDNMIIISFSDTGEGIPPDEKSRIFDPFYTTKSTGTGLGLSISYQSIKLHGGTIVVDSDPNIGSTFIITLPVTPQLRDRSDLL